MSAKLLKHDLSSFAIVRWTVLEDPDFVHVY